MMTSDSRRSPSTVSGRSAEDKDGAGSPAPPDPPRILLEQIGDEVFPYFADDRNATHPDDGRMRPDDE